VYLKNIHIYYIELFQGSKIHASIRRTLICKFQTEISEGHVYAIQNFSVAPNFGIYRITHHPYKINFQFGTKVSLLHGNLVPDMKPQYTPLSLLTTSGFDTDYLVGKLIFLVFLPLIFFSYQQLFLPYMISHLIIVIKISWDYWSEWGLKENCKLMERQQN